MEYNLRKIRELRGLTQNELAKKSGISRVTISRIESGTQEDLMVALPYRGWCELEKSQTWSQLSEAVRQIQTKQSLSEMSSPEC